MFSTITDNHAPTGYGGGISGQATVAGSIIAANTAETNPDLSGTFEFQSSLIGVEPSTNYTNGGGNLLGTAATPIDPLLGPLADNGGPSFTHALLPGSPAIDAGDAGAVAGVGNTPLFDQRGSEFSRVAGGRIDIGAFEVQNATLVADGNGDGWVDGLDYLLWAANYGTSPGPDGDVSDGDYNDDGAVDGLDYLLWASNYGNHATVAASQPASVQQKLAAVDIALESAYSDGASIQDWQISQAFDAVLKHKDKKSK